MRITYLLLLSLVFFSCFSSRETVEHLSRSTKLNHDKDIFKNDSTLKLVEGDYLICSYYGHYNHPDISGEEYNRTIHIKFKNRDIVQKGRQFNLPDSNIEVADNYAAGKPDILTNEDIVGQVKVLKSKKKMVRLKIHLFNKKDSTDIFDKSLIFKSK